MKKLSTTKTDKLLLKYVIKVILSSIISIILFSLIFSQIVYKLDISLDICKIIGTIICCLSAFIIAAISVSGLKNNGILMGAVSEIPLIFYSLINAIFYNNNIVLFFIKLVLILIIGATIGFIRAKSNKKFKVK